jgi:integrase
VPDYTIQRFREGWAVVWRDGEGKRRRQQLAAADRPGAEAEARQRWRIAQGSPRTVGGVIEAYIADREASEVLTVTRMKDAWKAMKPFWAEILPERIDEEMARSYAAQRKRAAATVRYELGMLAVALRWAKAEKLIPDAPSIWRPAPPERRERHLSREQFRRFLNEVKAPHARLYMQLAIATCARPAALLELTWEQIDFRRGLIDLNPPGRAQTKKRRPVVPIADYVEQALKDAYAARQGPFVIERGGEKIASIKKAFVAASERSKVKVTPYMLRHTGAVWRAEDGVPMAELAQLMGHDDSRTTEKHYARFTPTYLRRAANAGAW